jgi:hypothetical protein
LFTSSSSKATGDILAPIHEESLFACNVSPWTFGLLAGKIARKGANGDIKSLELDVLLLSSSLNMVEITNSVDRFLVEKQEAHPMMQHHHSQVINFIQDDTRACFLARFFLQ